MEMEVEVEVAVEALTANQEWCKNMPSDFSFIYIRVVTTFLNFHFHSGAILPLVPTCHRIDSDFCIFFVLQSIPLSRGCWPAPTRSKRPVWRRWRRRASAARTRWPPFPARRATRQRATPRSLWPPVRPASSSPLRRADRRRADRRRRRRAGVRSSISAKTRRRDRRRRPPAVDRCSISTDAPPPRRPHPPFKFRIDSSKKKTKWKRFPQ